MGVLRRHHLCHVPRRRPLVAARSRAGRRCRAAGRCAAGLGSVDADPGTGGGRDRAGACIWRSPCWSAPDGLRRRRPRSRPRAGPPALATGRPTAHGSSTFTPRFASPSAATFKAYAGASGTVGLHLAYFRGQNDDRKLVSSTNVLVGMRDDHWALPISGSRSLTVGDQTLALRTAEILDRERDASRRSRLVVWRLYWIDGRFITGDVQAKLAGVAARLRGRGDEGALLVLYADGDTVAASNAALEAFVQANLNELNALLQRTRDSR
ncbi:MAG: EpsI family protein [Rubrivivax sp.]|nr:EpsI family protein [Rubrivivax sp.]